MNMTPFSCTFFLSLLLGVAIFDSVAGVKSLTNLAILKSSCSSTSHPDLCYSAVASAPELSDNLSSQRDVIMATLKVTANRTNKNILTVKNLFKRKNLTGQEKTALQDCLDLLDDTLDEVQKAEDYLQSYPNTKKSLAQHVEDMKTLISSAMTNQDTCLNGFNYADADKPLKYALQDGELYVEKMCGNSLAMIKNMTGAGKGRKLAAGGGGGKWPAWLTAGDRRLLQAPAVAASVVVAADGTGDFKTVSEAVEAAPEKSKTRHVIRIKAGVYNENVIVPKKKTNLMFVGDGNSTTIITGSRNVVDGSTTYHSATVAVVGERFLARDITFQNTAGPSKHQAVALRVNADLSAFYRCNMVAYQDTLYVHSNRQFYVGCTITGTVDFIFGNAASLFQDCDIRPRRPGPGQKNMVTAQGRIDPNQNTGIVIQKCRIEASADLAPVQSSFPTYLGRPWKMYSRTIVMQSMISDVINPAGWHEWNGNFALDTLEYREYQNSGNGVGTASRVTWKGYKVINSPSEAQQYTAANFIAGSNWLGSTSFPFSLGL
ncbi:Pectinesterase [Bertholletia excelsa]